MEVGTCFRFPDLSAGAEDEENGDAEQAEAQENDECDH